MFNKYFFILFKFLCLSLFVTTAAQNSNNFKFLGCYLEENLLSLGEENIVLTTVSPQSCSEYCSGKQYLFFILKNDICYCSKNYISRLMKQFDQDCTRKCPGDNASSCGGIPNLVSFYITDGSKSNNIIGQGGYPIPIYLGCYSETPNDDENRLLKGPAQTLNNNTPQRCSEICFKMGYIHFGVTYGTECWCGNQKPSKTAKIDDVNCNSPCAGDSKQSCGGGWKISVYSTGITDYIPKKYVGCFEDEENDNKERNLIMQMGTNNSPKRCMNLCNTQQFRYADVKGSVCTCKNTEPNYSLKRSFSDCNTLCQENPSEYCGGSITTSIYKTLYSDPPGNAEMSYMGCFNNFKRHPTFNSWRITFTRLTPKHCVNSCFSRRFPYAALSSSKECLCSFIKPYNEAKTQENLCTIPCSGSAQHSCGGNNVVNVYSTGLQGRTDEIGNYYLGCFEESQNNRIFNGYSRSHSTNTPEFCSSLCYKFGYPYSGVTYKSECFCGIQPPSEPKFPKVDDKQCNTKCTGDSNQYCGGGWRMGVFATGLQDFQVNERSIGCFVIYENTLNNMKFELINTNKPSTCSAICNNAGYQFAGVSGINCLCGNRAPDNDHKVHDSECDTNCVADSSRTCGGEDRIQIFDLTKFVNISDSSNTTDLKNRFDDFDHLNIQSLWNYDVYIPQEPDFEFNIFNNSARNVYVKNGELIIKPTILTDNFVKRGILILKKCTKNKESSLCNKNATAFNIIPPIILSRITTIDHLSFLYGQLEVVAKFPSGDWLISEIALVSKSNEQNKLILATVLGNNNLKCNDIDESSTVVKYGFKIDKQYHIPTNLMKSTSDKRWTDDYHSFVLSWTHENIIVKIDGESNFLDTSNLPLDIIFDAEYYISIGVSVGGLNTFRDDCISNGHLKPWKNSDPKASLNFWKDRNRWLTTWGEEKSTMRIKSVKFTAIDNNNN